MTKKKSSAKAKSVAPKKAIETAAEEKLAAYNDVVRVAELSTVLLVGSEFKVMPDYYSAQDNLSLHTGLSKDEVVYDEEDGALTQAVHFHVEAKVDEEVQLSVKASYVVAYAMREAVEAQAAKEFVDRVAVFTAYPYFRARVAQYSWEASADLPPLPMIKAPPRAKKA